MPRLFIGNIPHASSEQELQDWVESRGFRVEAAEIIYDRSTGRSRGFGFVSIAEEGSIQTAINALNGQRLIGRVLTVNEAVPLTAAPTHHAERKPDAPQARSISRVS